MQIIPRRATKIRSSLPTLTLPGTPMHKVVCFHLKNEILVQDFFFFFFVPSLFRPLVSDFTISPSSWCMANVLLRMMIDLVPWLLVCHLSLVFFGGICVRPTYSKDARKADHWRASSRSSAHSKLAWLSPLPPACKYGQAVRIQSWRGRPCDKRRLRHWSSLKFAHAIFMAFRLIKAVFDPLISRLNGFWEALPVLILFEPQILSCFSKKSASRPPPPELTLSPQCVLAFSPHVACKLLTH